MVWMGFGSKVSEMIHSQDGILFLRSWNFCFEYTKLHSSRGLNLKHTAINVFVVVPFLRRTQQSSGLVLRDHSWWGLGDHMRCNIWTQVGCVQGLLAVPSPALQQLPYHP